MRYGLSPSLMSPTIEYTAGTLVHTRQKSSRGGVICVVSGYPNGGSDGCRSLCVTASGSKLRRKEHEEKNTLSR